MAKSKKASKAIQIGSVVQFKSGGPFMTVVKGVSSGDSTVLTVLWIAEERFLQKADVIIQAFKLIR
jgi:hypothetical protein